MGKQARRSGGPSGPPRTDAELVLDAEEASLLDIVDNVLTKGVVLSGDLTISLAQVDLVYARLSLLLCAADRVLPGEPSDFLERRQARRRRAGRAGRRRGAGA
ncbi:MAG: gas vesicle protein [Acidobacteria bacterium]|nr:gas vesicle protein [Acidobacteriota bacterium]